MHLWLLEDDPAQAQLLMGWLQTTEHTVQHFDRGQALIEALDTSKPDFDLVVLDWELPDATGIEVLHHIRNQIQWHVPVLFVTQREAESDIINALASGADDYMIKQINQGEFLARINALGRRLANQELDFEIGAYHFKPQSQSVLLNGEPCDLTSKDFELAWYLFRHIGRLLSRDQLLRDVWGVTGLNTRTVDVHVSRIRKRMNINPGQGFRIKTIYQHGYRLEQI